MFFINRIMYKKGDGKKRVTREKYGPTFLKMSYFSREKKSNKREICSVGKIEVELTPEVVFLEQVFTDPQIIERAMVVALQHPIAGAISVLGVPVKLSDTPGTVRTPPPTLGQHTAEVLGELGMTSEDIARFEAGGAI